MNNAILLVFITLLSIFAITLIFQLNMFRIKQGRSFSFHNEMPFELVEGLDKGLIHYQYLLYLIISTLFLAFGFFYVKTPIFYYEILLLISLLVNGILFYLMFFLKVSALKKHLFILTFYIVTLATSFLSFGLYMQLSPHLINNNLPIAIISYILGIVTLGLVLNPKLKKWPIMDKIEQQDGTNIILRPKKFILAIYEWIYVVFHFVLIIVMFVGLLLQ